MFLAIDQGLSNIGLVVFDKDYNLIHKEYIITSSYDYKRFNRTRQEIFEIIKEFNIKVILVEDLMIFNNKDFYGVKQAIKVTGIIQYLAEDNDLLFYELPLRSIKYNNGKGNLNKEESMKITGEINDHISDAILIFNYFKTAYLDHKTNIQKFF